MSIGGRAGLSTPCCSQSLNCREPRALSISSMTASNVARSVSRAGTPFVVRRLNALRDELKREEFDVAAANRALKAAVEGIVLNPENARLELHWRDRDVVSELRLWTKHQKVFSEAD
jgi:BioD-like phosphotransacetylase family protein